MRPLLLAQVTVLFLQISINDSASNGGQLNPLNQGTKVSYTRIGTYVHKLTAALTGIPQGSLLKVLQEHIRFSPKQLHYFHEKLDLQRIEQLLRANKKAPPGRRGKPDYSPPEVVTFELPRDCEVGQEVEVPGCSFSATGDRVVYTVEEGFNPGETVDIELPEGAVHERVASTRRPIGKERTSSSKSVSLGASGPEVT